MVPSLIVFIIVQILLFPLTFCGLIFETIINIIGSVCGAIKNNALKIILAIIIAVVIVGAFVCVYYFGGKFLSTLKLEVSVDKTVPFEYNSIFIV